MWDGALSLGLTEPPPHTHTHTPHCIAVGHCCPFLLHTSKRTHTQEFTEHFYVQQPADPLAYMLARLEAEPRPGDRL